MLTIVQIAALNMAVGVFLGASRGSRSGRDPRNINNLDERLRCIAGHASSFVSDFSQVGDDLFKREERTIRRRPSARSSLLVDQQQDAMFAVLRTEIPSRELRVERLFELGQRPALGHLHLDRQAGVRGFGPKADVGLLLIGHVRLTLH